MTIALGKSTPSVELQTYTPFSSCIDPSTLQGLAQAPSSTVAFSLVHDSGPIGQQNADHLLDSRFMLALTGRRLLRGKLALF